MAIIGLSGKKQSGKDTIARIIQYLTTDKKNISYAGSYNSYVMDIEMGGSITSDWQIKRFSDKLKEMVCLLIGCTREQLEDGSFKEKELGEEWWYFKNTPDGYGSYIIYPYIGNEQMVTVVNYYLIKLTPRKILQLLGTEVGRQVIHPNTWVNALMSEYKLIGVSTKYSEEFINRLGDRKDDKYLIDPFDTIYPNWIITDVRFPNEAKAIKDRGGKIIRVEREGTEGDTHESETALDGYKDFDWYIRNDSTIENLIGEVKLALWNFKIIQQHENL